VSLCARLERLEPELALRRIAARGPIRDGALDRWLADAMSLPLDEHDSLHHR
jgi:hypothetical protein